MLVIEAKDENRHTIDTTKKRIRNQDNGPAILPYMQYFVQLVRKVQRAELLKTLIEKCHASSLSELSFLNEFVFGPINPAIRSRIFTAVASFSYSVKHNIECIAERVILLCDSYGMLAIEEQFDPRCTEDITFLTLPSDIFSRALYLYLSQEFSHFAAIKKQRFDHAEARQEMLRQGHSEQYSSHYLGPKGIEPQTSSEIDAHFCENLAQLFSGIDAENILVETYVRREVNQPEQPITLYILKAMFNGTPLRFQKIINDEIVDLNESIVTQIEYAWQPTKGILSVYCDDSEIRSELAILFRDTILVNQTKMCAMTMREFNLLGFSSPAILERIKTNRIDGIENIAIQDIVIAKPKIHHIHLSGKTINCTITNDLHLRRHPFDNRNIYEIAQEYGRIADLSRCEILKVTLSMRIARRRHRNAHNVSVEIVAPNRVNDRSQAKEDRELILHQLEKLGCACSY